MFSHSAKKNIIIVNESIKNLVICLKAYSCTCMVCFAYNFKATVAGTTVIFLIMNIFTVMYPYLKPFTECINNAGTNTMKTAGYLVTFTAEFTAGMKNGKNNFNCCNTHFRMNTCGYTTTVIGYAYYVILFNFYFDMCTEASQGFVNRVIHNFINKMMKTIFTCRAYVHTGTLSYSL